MLKSDYFKMTFYPNYFQVVACVEESDCRTDCFPDVDNNGIKRRKREVDTGAGAGGKTEGWEENMELRVTLPDDRKMTGPVPDPSECRLFLIVTLATALTFCLLSACIVVFACYRRFAETRRKNKLGPDTASIKSNSSAGFKSRNGAGEDQNGIQVDYIGGKVHNSEDKIKLALTP